MFVFCKLFSDKFNKLKTDSMIDNKIDNDEYKELVKVYQEYRENKKNQLNTLFN